MIWAIITLLIILADQMVKYLVSANMSIGESAFSVLGLFDITYVQNEGAAFSLLSGNVEILSIISIVFCIAVSIWWFKKMPTHPLLCTAVVMMFAGAFGNAIDRVLRGYVVDYIRTLFIDFPVFNIADIGITVGAALLIIYTIWFDKEGNNADADN